MFLTALLGVGGHLNGFAISSGESATRYWDGVLLHLAHKHGLDWHLLPFPGPDHSSEASKGGGQLGYQYKDQI